MLALNSIANIRVIHSLQSLSDDRLRAVNLADNLEYGKVLTQCRWKRRWRRPEVTDIL